MCRLAQLRLSSVPHLPKMRPPPGEPMGRTKSILTTISENRRMPYEWRLAQA